jgi:hypothetical protein
VPGWSFQVVWKALPKRKTSMSCCALMGLWRGDLQIGEFDYQVV